MRITSDEVEFRPSSLAMLIAKQLGTAATHHRSLILGHIAAESLLFRLVQAPFLIEWVQAHLHHSAQDVPVTLLLNPFNHFVQDPAPGDKL